MSKTQLTMAEEEVIMNKFECLKDLRDQNLQLERIRKCLKNEVDSTEVEEKCLIEYRRELEALIREKMAHVEELRQIHADINSIESVIKQSEEEKTRHIDRVRHLHQEYQPLKENVDRLRADLGLPRLPELHEEDEKFKSDFFKSTPVSQFVTQPSVDENAMNQLILSASAANAQHNLHLASAAAAAAAAVNKQNLQPTMANFITNRPTPTSALTINITEKPSMAAGFRQQPPPMKSCLSCHQQIHRNAPICPLCKAKSRSRNPKKPRRKAED